MKEEEEVEVEEVEVEEEVEVVVGLGPSSGRTVVLISFSGLPTLLLPADSSTPSSFQNYD